MFYFLKFNIKSIYNFVFIISDLKSFYLNSLKSIILIIMTICLIFILNKRCNISET